MNLCGSLPVAPHQFTIIPPGAHIRTFMYVSIGIAVPSLVVNIGLMPRQLTLHELEVTCSLEDEVRYSSYLGQEVLVVGRKAESLPRVSFATARLSRFSPKNEGNIAVLTNLQIMPSEEQVPSFLKDDVFALLPDEYSFVQPDGDKFNKEVEEASALFHPLDTYGQIAQQVRLAARGICAFSGVEALPGEGSATPIQPVSLGGRVHVRNFIYLHDEPAAMFSRFAWTVGPELEIIADAHAVTAQMLSTVNPTGKLVISDDPADRPDERALAWHREQFMQRLR